MGFSVRPSPFRPDLSTGLALQMDLVLTARGARRQLRNRFRHCRFRSCRLLRLPTCPGARSNRALSTPLWGWGQGGALCGPYDRPVLDLAVHGRPTRATSKTKLGERRSAFGE